MKDINEKNYLIAYIISIAIILAFIAAVVGVFREPLMDWLGMALIAYPFWSPSAPQLMLCQVCKIDTVHHRTASGEWVCWCGAAAETEADNTKESE